MPSQKKNPVLKVINGVSIRKYNYPSIMFNDSEYEDLVNQSQETGLSISQIISLRSRPCQKCGCDNTTITIKKEHPSYKRIETGSNIIQRNNGKKH
jgi:hypothetical protein